MRKYIYTLICAVACIFPSVAQESGIPDAFNCGKAYWVTVLYYLDCPKLEWVMTYRLCNDTVIDGNIWKKLYSCRVKYTDVRTMNPDTGDLDFGNAVGCMRSDGGMIYGIVLDKNGFMHESFIEHHDPILLYDFSKDVGANVGSGEMPEYIELKEIKGYERKFYYDYAEGIGDLWDGPFGPVQLGVTGENPTLIYCSVDGEIVYEYKTSYESIEMLRCAYDLIIDPSVYGSRYDNPEWTIGKLKDGKITETYKLSKIIEGNTPSGQYIVSSLTPDEKITIEYGEKEWNDGKVYCDIDGTQHLLYDFRLDKGETFDNGIRRMTVTSVDTLMIEGFERPVLTFDNGERWIDGLGSTCGLLSPITEDSEDYDEILLSCRAGDTVMYLDPQYGSGIAPVGDNVCEIRMSGTNLEIRSCSGSDHIVRLYDAGGSAVVSRTFTGSEGIFSLSALQGGVYIVTVDGIVCGKVVI